MNAEQRVRLLIGELAINLQVAQARIEELEQLLAAKNEQLGVDEGKVHKFPG